MPLTRHSRHRASPMVARGVTRARRARIAFRGTRASRATPAPRRARPARGSERGGPGRATCPSSRASGAPRQKWMPWPNARWRLSARRRSRRSGSGNWRGSRLAALIIRKSAIPAVDHPAVDGQVLASDAHHRRRGAVEAQELLDGRDREGRILAPGPGRGRIPEQGEHAVADEVRGGLVSGEQEQHAAGDQLGPAQSHRPAVRRPGARSRGHRRAPPVGAPRRARSTRASRQRPGPPARTCPASSGRSRRRSPARPTSSSAARGPRAGRRAGPRSR